jgi:hypothetical protein
MGLRGMALSWLGHGDVEPARALAAVALNRFASEIDSRDSADDVGDFKPSRRVGDPHAVEIDWLGRNQSAFSRLSVPFLT